MKRAEVWWVNFEPAVGGEVGCRRENCMGVGTHDPRSRFHCRHFFLDRSRNPSPVLISKNK